MPLSVCIASHTHREYLVWQVWLRERWNKPSRTDHYLMQIAREVFCVLRTKTQDITLGMFKIPFEFKKPVPKKEVTMEQAAAAAKARWFGWLGIKRK